MAGAGAGVDACGFFEQQLDTGGDCEASLEDSFDDIVLWFCAVEGVYGFMPFWGKLGKMFGVPSSILRLSGMFSNALAIFPGAACMVLCLLPDF
jgi:hypothetical protein